MPLAEESLRDRLVAAGGPLPLDQGLAILTDVGTALADLDGRVVHRDLKPENVLLVDGRWCLTDFGISRYTEAATATETHKWSGTLQYLAPERWRSERATSATDVYALGVMAYELLTYDLPFPGPGTADFRNQHLHAEPPPLAGVTSRLAALIEECLYKAPGARPSSANVLARLQRAADTTLSPGATAPCPARPSARRPRAQPPDAARRPSAPALLRCGRAPGPRGLPAGDERRCHGQRPFPRQSSHGARQRRQPASAALVLGRGDQRRWQRRGGRGHWVSMIPAVGPHVEVGPDSGLAPPRCCPGR
jgi:serine/threonine protein kinase